MNVAGSSQIPERGAGKDGTLASAGCEGGGRMSSGRPGPAARRVPTTNVLVSGFQIVSGFPFFFFFAINNTIMNILKHQSECLSVYALRIKELRSHMGWQFLRILMIAFQRGLSTNNGDRAHSVAPSTVVAAKVTTTTEERASVCLMREAAFPACHGLLLIQFSRPPL